MCGWDIEIGEKIYGIVIRLMASADSSFSVDKAMAEFYNSTYFEGVGCKPLRKEGF